MKRNAKAVLQYNVVQSNVVQSNVVQSNVVQSNVEKPNEKRKFNIFCLFFDSHCPKSYRMIHVHVNCY